MTSADASAMRLVLCVTGGILLVLAVTVDLVWTTSIATKAYPLHRLAGL